MAVPFYRPDDDGNDASQQQQQQQNQQQQQYNPQQQHRLPQTPLTPLSAANSTSTSATQTPLQSPVTGEHLVQAFYDALYLLTNQVAVTPGFPSPPSSPSCSGYYQNRGNVFFAPPNSVPLTPMSPQQLHFQPQQQQQQWYPSPAAIQLNRRRRLNSTGSEDEEEEEFRSMTESSSSSSNTSINGSFDAHFSLMDARECLPEFSGQVPLKKKSNRIESVANEELKSKTKTKDQKFAWPTVVTAVVLAVGCGYLVSR